ncbi:hypothetical protein H072_9749 [Dactylellina haptotyla CBS 200.50]|uniref:C2H2-type domain-containing protein n=1 Tax=Dactylellina haptotyla (strain CBS 200.50) TaxID=1284197 RepID=S8A1U4_DACHA|nr:hypothetical protein H072_9749 [Dactylellina haptotyla CBS 200.50]
MSDNIDRYYVGVLPPFPRVVTRYPPLGYHLYPFCFGDYSKYCPNPFFCPKRAVWMKEEIFGRLHLSSSSEFTEDDIVDRHLLAFLNNMELARESRKEECTQNTFTATPKIGAPQVDQMVSTARLPTPCPNAQMLDWQVSKALPFNAPSQLQTPIRRNEEITMQQHSQAQAFAFQIDKPQPRLNPHQGYDSTISPPTSPENDQISLTPPTTPDTPSPTLIRCKWSTCTLNFYSQEETLEHIKSDHIGSRKMAHYDFTCRIRDCPCAGKVFEKRDNIVSHVTNVGFDIRYAICPFKKFGCGVALKREWDLPRHIKICKFSPDKIKDEEE